jgi:8-amino-7-oxononanoate synthase
LLTENPIWDDAVEQGILNVPLSEDWEHRDFQTHIVPLRTRSNQEMLLFFQLIFHNMNAYPMVFPVVPKGQSRIRLVFHAHNTFEQIETLVTTICNWVREMIEIEHGKSESGLPQAARHAYAMQSAMQKATQN